MDKKRPSRPWDIFNEKFKKIEKEVVTERLAFCTSCPELIKLTSMCKKCGCHMPTKVKLANSFCPIGKWDSIDIDISSTNDTP
jgi:hypothetical protein